MTEGNYLLVDDGDWARVRPLLDESWYVEMDEDTRLDWLIQRHIEFGKAPDAARAWVMRSDQANAAVTAATRERAGRDRPPRGDLGRDHARADGVVRRPRR